MFTTKYHNTCPAPSGTGVLQLRGAPSTIKDGDLTTIPVLYTGVEYFGAEVMGVDWSRPVLESVVEQVRGTHPKDLLENAENSGC